jgi:hypothetical protein
VWLVSYLVKQFVLASHREEMHPAIMELVQMEGFHFVLRKRTGLGVLPVMQMTKGQ